MRLPFFALGRVFRLEFVELSRIAEAGALNDPEPRQTRRLRGTRKHRQLRRTHCESG